ncbi:MAG: hypothetical protein QXW90_02460 [Candidatus Micrarchaeaceae archaeon]
MSSNIEKSDQGSDQGGMKRLARDSESVIASSLNSILKDVSKEVKKYIEDEKKSPGSDVQRILDELKKIGENYGITLKLFVLPNDISKLNRALETNLVEDVSKIMNGGVGYSIEAALFKCIGDTIAKKIGKVADELKFASDYVNEFAALISGLHISMEMVAKNNNVSVGEWFRMGNYYATFLNVLMIINAPDKAPETKETTILKKKLDELLSYSLDKLSDMGFVLDYKLLTKIWDAIGKKYSFDKQYPKLQSFEAISRLTDLFNNIKETYNEVDGTFSLEVFVITEAAEAIVNKATELGSIMGVFGGGDEEGLAYKALADNVINLNLAINEAKKQNAFGGELLKLMNATLELLERKLPEQAPPKQKEPGGYI